MIDTRLTLPTRDHAPRTNGLTMMIDPGLFTAQFTDAVESVGEYVDLVKFGWGTALVTRDVKRKIDVLREAGIAFYFGGTLFERFAAEEMVDDYHRLCTSLGATHVEVSNGTIPMGNAEKAHWIARLSQEFTVVSEVGFKDQGRSAEMTSHAWTEAIRSDFAAGASIVTTEARESGRSGLCTVVEDVLGSGVDLDRMLFEAPTKELQVWFLHRLGAAANLGNVAAADVIGLETLRLGLRSDTLRVGD